MEQTGVSRNDIGMIERGETNPTLIVMHDIAQALETNLKSLVEGLPEGSSKRISRAFAG